MPRWNPDDLDLLARAEELDVAPLRADRERHARPTTIWSVVVDGEVYVRAYGGPQSHWFRLATAQQAGRIRVVGRTVEVRFSAADPAVADRIDAAYRAKYGRSAYLAPMLASGARTAALRVRPVGEDS